MTESKSIDWILYDMDLRHERVKFSFDGEDERLVHLMTDTTVKAETLTLACNR